MAYIRDSVIDQFGNAIGGARIDLFNMSSVLIGTVFTDVNGFFEFSVLTGSYRIQISGIGLTTRLIGPIIAIDPYSNVTYDVSGLMTPQDKFKLDGLPEQIKISMAADFWPHTPGNGDIMVWVTSAQLWSTMPQLNLPFGLLADFVHGGGTVAEANKYPKLDGNGRLSYTFLNVTPVGGQSQYQGRIPVLDLTGRLDVSMFNASNVGGPGFQNFLVKLNAAGLIDMTQLNTATVGGASSAGKIPKLNSSGRVDPSMLPTTSGTFRGSLDLTVAYVAPGWADGDYGSCSAAGTVHATWVDHLNEPIPTTVKVGDSVYYTGGKFSVVPSSTDLSAYLPRDGSQPMTDQLALITHTAGNLPTTVQALSRAAGDLLYAAIQVGAIPSVTQTTSKATAVALNAIEGKIVTHNSELKPAAMAGPRPVSFSLSNTFIKPDSVILVNHQASGTTGAYRVWAGMPIAGSCTIWMENITGAALSQAITLQFHVFTGGN